MRYRELSCSRPCHDVDVLCSLAEMLRCYFRPTRLMLAQGQYFPRCCNLTLYLHLASASAIIATSVPRPRLIVRVRLARVLAIPARALVRLHFDPLAHPTAVSHTVPPNTSKANDLRSGCLFVSFLRLWVTGLAPEPYALRTAASLLFNFHLNVAGLDMHVWIGYQRALV